MNGFYITISNGLLKDEHRKRMGTAVWEFMWLIDRVTSVNEDGVGKVLGGKPIQLAEISEGMNVSEKTVSRNLVLLEKQGYISKKRTPFGMVITVNRTKKRFGKNPDDDKKMVPKNKAKTSERTKVSDPRDRTKVSDPVSIMSDTKKTQQRHNSLDNVASEKTDAPQPTEKIKSDHVQFMDFYWKAVQVTRGIKPIITGADGANLKRILKLGIERSTLEKVTLYFLAEPSFKSFSPSISTLTSAGILNGIMNRMTPGNDEQFWKQFQKWESIYLPKIYETIPEREIKQTVDPEDDAPMAMKSMRSCMEKMMERFAKPGEQHNYQLAK